MYSSIENTFLSVHGLTVSFAMLSTYCIYYIYIYSQYCLQTINYIPQTQIWHNNIDRLLIALCSRKIPLWFSDIHVKNKISILISRKIDVRDKKWEKTAKFPRWVKMLQKEKTFEKKWKRHINSTQCRECKKIYRKPLEIRSLQ